MSIAAWHVGNSRVTPCDPDSIDPRGLLWVWEEPRRDCQYVLGCDPTFGITGWHRSLRKREDVKTDNAAIEIFRVGGNHADVQVAEWAAPIDAVELADIINFLGKLYCGTNEDGQGLVCVEVYPGPGWMTQRELINKFGYTNLPPWLVENSVSMKATHKIGWFSTKQTRRDLWVRGTNHLSRGGAVLNSPWLIEEMADCTPDNFLSSTSRAIYGSHDDRVVANLIALWYANEWSLAIEPTERSVAEPENPVNFQACDISAKGMMEQWEDKFAQLLED